MTLLQKSQSSFKKIVVILRKVPEKGWVGRLPKKGHPPLESFMFKQTSQVHAGVRTQARARTLIGDRWELRWHYPLVNHPK